MPIIELQHVEVTLGGNAILRDISFDIQAGECMALIGPNGSGKTTLLRAVAGHLDYAGSIRIKGRDLQRWKSKNLAREMSFVRQALPISFDFTSQEIVLLGRSPHKNLLQSYDARDYDLVKHLIEDLDLKGKEHRSILDLSGGERQRVLLAQSLAQETDIILLDEPTTHLDVHHKYDFMARVKEYSRHGKTIVAAIHDLQLAAQFADRVTVLSDGRLQASEVPERVLTPELISKVFDVPAEVTVGTGGSLNIQYNFSF